MASRRKKSRPTKIDIEEPLSDIELNNIDQDFLDHDDQAAKIKKFLEEESEDTPESRFEKIKPSPVRKILEKPDKSALGMRNMDISEAADAVTNFTNTNNQNGQVTSSLQFHQLTHDDTLMDYSSEAMQRNSTHYEYILALSKPGPTEVIKPDPVEKIIDEHDRSKVIENTDNFEGESVENSSTNDDNMLALAVPGVTRHASKRSRAGGLENSPRYSCKICKYVTNRSDHFKRHQMTHSSDKPLKCHKCTYGTGRSDHYKRHLQRHGMREEDIIECCARNGLKLKNVPMNLTTGGNAKKITKADNSKPSADLIKKDTPEKVKFLVSVESISNDIADREDVGESFERKFECLKCNYTTGNKSNLTRHQLSHSKNMFTSCAKCNKSFKTPSYLHRHRCKPQRRCAQCKQIFINHEAMLLHAAHEHPDTPQFVVTKEENSNIKTESTNTVVKNGKTSKISIDNGETSKISTDTIEIKYDKSCYDILYKPENNTAADSIEPMDLSKNKNEEQIPSNTAIHTAEVSERSVEIDSIVKELSGSNQTQPQIPTSEELSGSSRTPPEISSSTAQGSQNFFDIDSIVRELSGNRPTLLQISTETVKVPEKTPKVESSNDNSRNKLTRPKISVKDVSGLFNDPLQAIKSNTAQSDLTTMGNFRCTKCCEWFNKLTEYSSHTCVPFDNLLPTEF